MQVGIFRRIFIFLSYQLGLQRKNLFLWSPVLMGCGIIAYFTFDYHISLESLVIALICAILALAKSYHLYSKSGHVRWMIFYFVSVATFMVTLGYGMAQWRTYSVETVVLSQKIPPITIEGRIENLLLFDGGKSKRVVLNNLKIVDAGNLSEEEKAHVSQLFRVRLKTYHFKGDDWKTDDIVQVRAQLMPPTQAVMPGGFDFRFKAFYDGISSVGYTMKDAVLISRGQTDINYIGHLRSAIASNIYQSMENPENAGIGLALITGERSGINKEDNEAMQSAGLTHLLAISGLNIGMVSGFVFFAVRLILALIPSFALYYPIKKYAAICAIITAICYTILAVPSIPTVRACIMTVIVLVAVIMDRSAISLRLMALAAFFVMFTTPEAIMGPSFVLSFAAVAALIVCYQEMGRGWLVNFRSQRLIWRPVYYFIGIIATTVIATLATGPFTILYFNRFAVYSVIANMGAIPLMGFIIMPFSLIGVLLMPFGLDDWVWPINEWGIVEIIKIAHTVAAYPHSNLYWPSFDIYETFLIGFGFIILMLWQGVLRWIGLGMMVIAMISSYGQSEHKSIMISEDMKAIMIVGYSVDKMYLFGQMGKYLRQNWLGSMGYAADVDIPSQKNGDKLLDQHGKCDDNACILNLEGVKIGLIFNNLVMQKICPHVDIVITKTPKMKPFCKDAKVIDRFDIKNNGATSILFSNGRYNIQTVQ